MEIDHLEDLDIDRRIILKPASRNRMGMFTGFIWLKIGQVAGSCEYSSEPLSAIKWGEYLDWPKNC
jgi:hypothetical protein